MDYSGPTNYCSLCNKQFDCEKHRIGMDHSRPKYICVAANLFGVFQFGAFGINQQPNSGTFDDTTGSGCFHRAV